MDSGIGDGNPQDWEPLLAPLNKIAEEVQNKYSKCKKMHNGPTKIPNHMCVKESLKLMVTNQERGCIVRWLKETSIHCVTVVQKTTLCKGFL